MDQRAAPPFTERERDDFKLLGRVVERAAKSFVHAAAALFEIRERKLYRGRFERFEDYCQSVHNISRQYAYNLIKAGKIRAEMETIVYKLGLPGPANEAQLRELGRLGDPAQRGQVYIEVVEVSRGKGRAVTAADIKAVAEKKGVLAKAAKADGKTGRPAAMGAKDRGKVQELLAEALKEKDWTLVERALDLVDPGVPTG